MNELTRFSFTARDALNRALREATLDEVSTIDNRHLLIGLAQLPIAQSTAAHVLNGLGVTADKLRRKPKRDIDQNAQLDLSVEVKKVLERAASIAQKRGEKGISSAHLLAGLLADEAILPLLNSTGTTIERISEALHSLDDWTDQR